MIFKIGRLILFLLFVGDFSLRAQNSEIAKETDGAIDGYWSAYAAHAHKAAKMDSSNGNTLDRTRILQATKAELETARRKYEEHLQKFPNAKTFPQIIIDNKHIGGYHELEKWLERNSFEEDF